MKRRIIAALISGVVLSLSLAGCDTAGQSTVQSTDSVQSVVSEVSDATPSDITSDTSVSDTSTEGSSAEQTESQAPEVPSEPIVTDDPMEFAAQLAPGWNLGNQLEAVSGSVPSETAWGNPEITEDIILAVKEAGFKTIRIPVSYLSKIGEAPDYTIDPEWLDRVQQVVDMCMNNGMFAIINMHGDGYHTISGGWLFCDGEDQDTIKDKYGKVWAQIADKFKDYDEHLIFESMNEEFDGNYGAIDNDAYANIVAYNQIFVDTVRAAGGKNPDRYLLVPGWNTDINATTENETFELPKDDAGRVMVSVHFYDPYEFVLKEDAPGIFRWGQALKGQGQKTTWGDEDYLDEQFDKVYNKFIKQGIPVIIGEYGAIDKTYKDERSTIYRAYYAEYLNYAAAQRDIVTVLWDNGYNGKNGHAVFDRSDYSQTQPEIIAAIMKGLTDIEAPTAPTD